MKKHIPTVIAVISSFLVAACLFQIAELKNQLWGVQNDLSSQISWVMSSVDNIHFNIENTLKEQANLLESSSWVFDEVDIDNRAVIIRCAVTPKEYRPDDTAAILVCNDKEYPMTLSNGEYTAMLSVPLFGDSNFSKVQLIDDGTVRTAALNWWITPRFELLPQVNANFTGRGSGSVRDGGFNLERNGEIEIHIFQSENNFSAQSISMFEYINGEELERTGIPLNTVPSPRKDRAIPERAVSIYSDSETATDFYYQLNKSVAIPFDSTYEVYIEVVDNYGLHYRLLLDRTAIDSRGNPIDGMNYWHGAEADIYDASGNVLWESGKEMYY